MTSGVSHQLLEPFGVEIPTGFMRDLTSEDRTELGRLYTEHGLVLIRNLDLSMDEQLDLCSIFGPVLRNSRENYLVSNVHRDGLLGDMELLFHTDVPYVPAPYMGGSLHAIEVSTGTTSTRFASGFKAYERLPETLRDRLNKLNALYVRPRVADRRSRLTDSLPGDNCAVHPVVAQQRITGRPYLFVNMTSTGCIIGMSESESDELLEELFSYLYRDDNIYEHAWKKGDIIIWDNLSIQHARAKITGGPRTLQRVTIAEIGYWDQYPLDSATYDDLKRGQGFRTRHTPS